MSNQLLKVLNLILTPILILLNGSKFIIKTHSGYYYFHYYQYLKNIIN